MKTMNVMIKKDKYYMNKNTGTVMLGIDWINDVPNKCENSELWGIREPLSELSEVVWFNGDWRERYKK